MRHWSPRPRSIRREPPRLIVEKEGEAFILDAGVTDLTSVAAITTRAQHHSGRIDVLSNNTDGPIAGGPEEIPVDGGLMARSA